MLGKSERGCGTAEKGAYWGFYMRGKEDFGDKADVLRVVQGSC